MIICYFTKNREITECYASRESYVELLAMADDYNKNNHNEDKIHIRVVDDNSLEAYLVKKCKEMTQALDTAVATLRNM